MVFIVEGMHCAKCTANVEKAVLSIPNVTAVKVDLSEKQLTVRGDCSPDDVINAVEELGFGCLQK